MADEKSTHPSYLGLLNGISQGETNAGVYLSAWEKVTTDPVLQKTLATVAERETTHGNVFRQRIERLGFSLQVKENPDQANKVATVTDPNMSDLEKIQCLIPALLKSDWVEPSFSAIEEKINDVSVDQLTRDTLRWYVTEERDSLQLLRACAKHVQEQAAAGQANGAVGTPSADAQAIMACLGQGFASLQQTIQQASEGGRSAGALTNGSSTGPSVDAQAIMACMTEGFGSLQKSLQQAGAAGKRAK